MRRLFRQFSFPGGIPSHVAPETPGSIHEGGELGYSLAHAYGAAFDNPDLIVACVIGDGESETGPLAGSWHSNKFLNPVTDGAVLPILHLNGYKIANPTVPARIPPDELEALLTGYGHHVYMVEGDDPKLVHEQLAATLDAIVTEIHEHPAAGAGRREHRAAALAGARAAHAQGLDRAEGRGRQAGGGHLARPPGARSRRDAATPSTCASSRSGCGPTGRRSCSTPAARCVPEIAGLAPADYRRMSANPHANGGLLLRDLDLPRLPGLRGRRAGAGRGGRGEHPGARRLAAGRHRARTPRPSGCSARTRRPRTGSTRSSR